MSVECALPAVAAVSISKKNVERRRSERRKKDNVGRDPVYGLKKKKRKKTRNRVTHDLSVGVTSLLDDIDSFV